MTFAAIVSVFRLLYLGIAHPMGECVKKKQGNHEEALAEISALSVHNSGRRLLPRLPVNYHFAVMI